MGTKDFQGSLNEWLHHIGERVCQSGTGAVEIHKMYVDDLAGAGRLSGDSQVALAAGVYVDDKPSGSDRAEPVKKRRGLFAVVGSDLVLVRDASWGRVNYEFYTAADFTANSITFKPKGKTEAPGVGLWSPSDGVWFGLCPWHVGQPDMEQMQLVCNQMAKVINEAGN